ncbi:MAG: roadblock/LC7 domain-containing protein [Deltaproteobacteria bacterium]|nr:roadblock/LC7 domain-containing protein [Deltaproteobacteria bacterium]MBW1738098.1 roadblock/LC7 domain-containing protein [Deltaproteobacteria bacterium]MBW1908011.1 roadblock/LC7 domain-containing protein [Deltaproteobacteria bacterium]MBW2035240.1 roadblock/LC7 domain-containing protein [Deltaproteobacteria bacterium]
MRVAHKLSKNQLDRIEEILQRDFIDPGVHCAFLVDLAGNDIAHRGNGKFDGVIKLLPALAAGNFAAVSAMAKMIGDKNFALIFHKGENESMHFRKVMADLLIVSIFGNDFSLGLLRLKMNEAIRKIRKTILKP